MAKDKEPFDDLFEPFELEDGPPPPGTPLPPVPAPQPPAPSSAATTTPVEQVPCPSCGAYNPAYNRHCEQCGARLTKEPLPVAPAPMVRTTPGGRALSVLAAAVLVVALGALLVNVFSGGDDTAATTTTPETTTTTIAVLSPIVPTSVTASSQISAGFADSKVIDGDLTTEWQADQANDPLTLVFRFAQPVQIEYLQIYNITDEDRYLANYRIEGYKITVDDLIGDYRNSLKDEPGGPQQIDIGSIATNELTLEVLSKYPSSAVGDGPAFTELVVAEVKFWGTPSS